MGDWWFRAWDRVLAFKGLVGLSASPSDEPCDGWQRRLASDEVCRSKDPSPTAAKRTPLQDIQHCCILQQCWRPINDPIFNQ